ncbi:hypothetical protein BP5796_12599 [Coleophoma crateriformis]|uniref:Cytochrome P450 n=1 Tax=Coleophoma crateriformis TaxID=565419 RepID=A0A3D8Q841_9HELO|nr:hypothetical protein BP5796_12599 [Coleophoma crateriformis]
MDSQQKLLGILSIPLAWLAIFALACVWVFNLHKTVRDVNLAAASFGQKPYTILSYSREYARGILDFPGLLSENYARSNGEKPFVIPNPMFGPIVMVTAKHVSEYRFARDTELNAQEALHKVLQTRWTLPDKTWDSGPSFHPMHLRKYLQKSLGPSTPDLATEINLSMSRFWDVESSNGDWKEVDLLGPLLKIATQGINKLYIGEEIGRDEGYIDGLGALATAVVTCGLTLNLVPLPLKSIASTLMCWPTRYRRQVLIDRYLHDIIQRRKLQLEGTMAERETEEFESYTDYCMALLSAAYKDPNPAYYETENFVSRFMTHYIAAIFTISVTISGVVEKLIQHPHMLSVLRDEANAVFIDPKDPHTWRKTDIAHLDIHDSFIRESMRTTPVSFAVMRRSAIKPEGYTFLDGTVIPSYFEVGVPLDQLHHDEKYYKDARQFDPLRFIAKSKPTDESFADGSGTIVCRWVWD